MTELALTTEMIVVLFILACTVTLFVTEAFRIDFTALMVLIVLGLLSQIPALSNLADPSRLFDGFASNAVMSIIATMIIGAGLDKTGLMNKISGLILRVGGSNETRITPIISMLVGFISSFMQNVGAAALCLPVVSRISARTGLPMSRLLMPMGFCAILGGTVTMVGSSPLVLLNDLILATNASLPDAHQMEPFGLFDVTPIGLGLVLSGIVYFAIFGRFVLPRINEDEGSSGQTLKDYMRGLYGLETDVFEVIVPRGSALDGHLMSDVMNTHHVHILASFYNRERHIMPVASEVRITAPCRLAITGSVKDVEDLAEAASGIVAPQLDIFAEDFSATAAGVAELVIPPGSSLIGSSAINLRMRKTYGFSIIGLHRGEDTFSHVESEDHRATDVAAVPFQSGDTLIGFTRWNELARLTQNRDFVVVTQDFPREDLKPHKVLHALSFFVLTLVMILFTDVRLSLCLLTGAAGMILTRVLTLDEAYDAVSWSTVFLLACLIPLGHAVQNTGTAAWIAQEVLRMFDGLPVFVLQTGVAILATAFTLVMSNVGATVLLVPLAVSIAIAAGGDPATFALTVAIATSNSFLIPTHQVNALIMGPASYKVSDFMKAGGGMTIVYLVVSMSIIYVIAPTT